MNNNETQLLNSVLAIAALSANISPEELKEYVNALSVDSSKVRSDDRFNDADILRSAVGLLRVYRDETIAKMVPAERHPFLRKITPAIGMLEECMEYFANKLQLIVHSSASLQNILLQSSTLLFVLLAVYSTLMLLPDTTVPE